MTEQTRTQAPTKTRTRPATGIGAALTAIGLLSAIESGDIAVLGIVGALLLGAGLVFDR